MDMKFNRKILAETLNQPSSGKKVFTEGKKQNVLLSEEQLDRLISQLQETKQEDITNTIKDAYKLIREAIKNERLDLSVDDYSKTITEQGMYDRNPGIAAGEGLENILNGIKKAYDMIKDSDTRKKLANSITKLGNFMTYTAELVGSGSSQRAPRSYDQVSKPLPHPEFEDSEVEIEEDSGHDEAMNYGRDEGHDDKELYDLKYDGGSEEHIEDLEDDMHYDHIHDSQHRKEKIIREDIRKMKQVIKPIAKSVLKETNSCEGLESDCDMNFVNKWLFPPRDGYGTTGQLTMVQWGGYDDKQRQILMDKAEKKSKV